MATRSSIRSRLATPEPSASGRRNALAKLSVALVLAMSTWFSATAVIAQLREEWGLSDSYAAWLTISVQLGFVAGAVVSSLFNLADVLPAQKVILGGALGAAAANIGLLLGETTALPLLFATGFFLAAVYPPTLKLMATWFREGRGVALGILVGALTVGSAFPHLVNALGGANWRTVVTTTSLLTVAGGLAAISVREGGFPFPRARFDPRQIRSVFSDRDVRLASFGYFGHMWELYAMWAWFVVFMRSTGVSSFTASLATFAVIGSGAIGCWLGGVIGDRGDRARLTIGMMLTSAACAVIVGPAAEASLFLALAVGLVWGISVVGDSAQFSTLVTERADQRYVGTALTLQLALGFTLTVATIWLLPRFVETVGWEWGFVLLAPGPLVGSAAMSRLSR
jgi:MFS family permease